MGTLETTMIETETPGLMVTLPNGAAVFAWPVDDNTLSWFYAWNDSESFPGEEFGPFVSLSDAVADALGKLPR